MSRTKSSKKQPSKALPPGMTLSGPPAEYLREFQKLRPRIVDMYFMNEVFEQCYAAVGAFDLMQQRRDLDPRDRLLLSMAHQMIVHAGMVAKLLFPAVENSTPTMRTRAKTMCGALGVGRGDVQALRRARNYLEHFDRDMESCFHKNPTGAIYSPTVVVDHEELKRLPEENKLLLKCLISSTWTLILLDETHGLREAATLLTRIGIAAKSEVEAIEKNLESRQVELEALRASLEAKARTGFGPSQI